MKVLVLPADFGGCGHYRLMFAAEHLRSLGHDIQIQYPNQGAGFEVHFQGDTMVDFRLPDDVDVLVMQRISHQWHTQAVPLIRSKGIAVVVDMDDDLSCIHRENAAYWTYSPRNERTPHSFKAAQEICRAATYVTVSTPTLLKVYASHNHGQVLENYVPERYLSVNPARTGEPVFGWAGTVQSHPSDLLVCGRGVQELINKGFKFKVIGPKNGVTKQFKLDQEPETTGAINIINWPYGVAKLDVGMAPLEASQFNRSKSHLKPLEYNSVGIPYVASPREEYRRYHRMANGGLLADSAKEWVSSISRLMTDDVLRKELGEQGRAHAATMTIEENSWKFWEAWTNAYNIQQGRKT